MNTEMKQTHTPTKLKQKKEYLEKSDVIEPKQQVIEHTQIK